MTCHSTQVVQESIEEAEKKRSIDAVDISIGKYEFVLVITPFGFFEYWTGICNTSPFDEMNQRSQSIAPGCDGLLFLPYMAGERSPIWDSRAKGVWYGLDFSKTRAHLIRACMEGVGYSLRHNLEVAKRAGAKVDKLYAMGGSANSLVWTQIKSDITGYEIDVPSSDKATVLGAALLAGVGAGVYSGFEEAVNKTVSITRTHTPNPDNASCYNNGYKRYLALYEHLKPMEKMQQ